MILELKLVRKDYFEQFYNHFIYLFIYSNFTLGKYK